MTEKYLKINKKYLRLTSKTCKNHVHKTHTHTLIWSLLKREKILFKSMQNVSTNFSFRFCGNQKTTFFYNFHALEIS